MYVNIVFYALVIYAIAFSYSRSLLNIERIRHGRLKYCLGELKMRLPDKFQKKKNL